MKNNPNKNQNQGNKGNLGSARTNQGEIDKRGQQNQGQSQTVNEEDQNQAINQPGSEKWDRAANDDSSQEPLYDKSSDLGSGVDTPEIETPNKKEGGSANDTERKIPNMRGE